MEVKKERLKFKVNAAACSGCRTCQLICALVNHGKNNPKLAHIKIIGQFPVPGGNKIKFDKNCNHCAECAKICPMHAIILNEPSLVKASEGEEAGK